MKKNIFAIIFIATGLLFSCSGEQKKQTQDKSDNSKTLQKEIKSATEKTNQEIEELIESSEKKIKESQSEIDSLLHNI
ncbi:MAG: hypothetical protein R6U95_10130 [Bacteroidales bacterium]